MSPPAAAPRARWQYWIAAASCILAACSRAPGEQAAQRLQLAAHRAVIEQLPSKFYEPGLGDLMQSLQLRHAKLWFAAGGEHWQLAAFELHEIDENLERIAYWHPHSEGVAMAPAVKAYTGQGRYALAQSIEARDMAAFAPAYDRLTAGCNACHEATGHAFIRIQRPSEPPVSNQQFQAPR